MTDDTDWIPDFIKATLERGARRLRGEDPGPTVMYTEVDGRMQRVDDGADLDRRRERKS